MVARSFPVLVFAFLLCAFTAIAAPHLDARNQNRSVQSHTRCRPSSTNAVPTSTAGPITTTSEVTTGTTQVSTTATTSSTTSASTSTSTSATTSTSTTSVTSALTTATTSASTTTTTSAGTTTTTSSSTTTTTTSSSTTTSTTTSSSSTTTTSSSTTTTTTAAATPISCPLPDSQTYLIKAVSTDNSIYYLTLGLEITYANIYASAAINGMPGNGVQRFFADDGVLAACFFGTSLLLGNTHSDGLSNAAIMSNAGSQEGPSIDVAAFNSVLSLSTTNGDLTYICGSQFYVGGSLPSATACTEVTLTQVF